MKMFKRMVVVILIVLLLSIPYCMSMYKSNSSQYTVYGTMKCPYTVKMIDELKAKDKTFTFKDVSKPDINNEYNLVKRGDSTGVPYTIDVTTGEHILGYRRM